MDTMKYIRRVQCNIFVFFLMILGVFFGLGNTSAFNLFSAWTKDVNLKLGQEYVKESSVDDTIIGTTLANLALGAGEYKSDASVKNTLNLFEISTALINVDILELINDAENPDDALGTHIKHIDKTLQEIDETVELLQWDAAKYAEESRQCLQEKNEGDKIFFEGLQASDEASLYEWLEQSLDASPCYITNRVKANAAVYMASKVATHRSILAKRKQLLEQQGDLLLDHTAYMEWNILEELLALRNQLNAVNQVNYSPEVGWSFNSVFNPSWTESALPNFGSLIPLDGYPTYNDPWNWKRE